MSQYTPEVLIIGAGASGMLCAMTAARRGRSVLLLDHAAEPAEKLRISGGGRCNFTNLRMGPEHYLSQNPHFCRSALARYTPQHFLPCLSGMDWVGRRRRRGSCSANEAPRPLLPC